MSMEEAVARHPLEEQLDKASDMAESNSANAVKIFKDIIAAAGCGEEVTKAKEAAIYKVGEIYAREKKASELSALLLEIRPFFAEIPKAKTAKIVRSLIDLVALIPNTLPLQIELCKESIAWTKTEKRTFLRQRIEARLAALYVESKAYAQSLALLTDVLREVKRLDDKPLLVEIHLVESRAHFALKNFPKAKAALISARTAANAIYCPPLLQASIDMQSGILHAEENDYKTAYSYFFESFEGFSSLDDPNAILCLKYMLMTKIMANQTDDVHALINGKAAIKYAGSEVEAMRSIADAHSKRSLHSFEDALKTFKEQLTDDAIINTHLSQLYDNLLEQNLTRLIEPFSRVEIAHIAKLIDLPVATVEPKLSQMILDKKFIGILDQGAGCLIAFDNVPNNKTYPAAIETMQHMGNVVDSLFEKASKLS